MSARAEPSFPRQQVRTRRFSLGHPRSFSISRDGDRVAFLRSERGDEPANSLWVYDVAGAIERQVVSPGDILAQDSEEVLAPEERARRERSRELAGGIVAYACDEAVSKAAFSLGGRLWWVDLVAGSGATRVELPSPPGIVDPRPDPAGDMVAFLWGARLCAVPTGGNDGYVVLAEDDDPDVTWGAAEFVAAEEMGRSRGYWWAPDGNALIVARVDNRPVTSWWTGDPSTPAAPPEAHRFPVAGSDDAVVSLWHVPVPGQGGEQRELRWEVARYPYLAAVHWGRYGPPLLLVEQRDHKACAVLAIDLAAGETSVVAEMHDPAWVDWPPGAPAWLESGQLVWAQVADGTIRLKVGPDLVTPPGLHVGGVTVSGRSVLFTGSSEPEVVEAWAWSAAEGLQALTGARGVSGAMREGKVTVVVTRSMDWDGPRAEVRVEGSPPRVLANRAETPLVTPDVRFLRVGERDLSVGVVLPEGHPGGKLPVLMAPYGGPGHQRVQATRSEWLEAQWFANQGFAVVVADGRGTPGRGPEFERQVYLDLAGPVLDDQVDALLGAADQVPELDLGRVGIKGWSFGGFLAALAVLSRPDIFHAAIAGAPVTDWRLYDTYYTERFLGHPDRHPEAYQRSSVLPLAPQLARPLLLIHGLADDNVYAAHTLELSRALLVAGRPHSFLPLAGITHVTGRADVSESLLYYQVDFLRRNLAAQSPP
jgi:dipeptidyl-peptidase-4